MARLRRLLVLAIGCVLVSALLAHSGAANAAPPLPSPPIAPEIARKFEPALLKLLAAQQSGLIPFIAHFQGASTPPPVGNGRLPERIALVGTLQAAANQSQTAVRALLAARQAAGRAAQAQTLWIINALSGQADRATILELAARPEIRLLRADHVRRLIDGVVVQQDQLSAVPSTSDAGESLSAGLTNSLLPGGASHSTAAAAVTVEWNVRQIGADRVWSAFNLDGTGAVVASLDSGVDWQHPALLSKYRGYRGGGPAVHAGNWFDASGSGYQYPGDGNGHGTHTMGTILGSTPAYDVGVAPGARWIAAKIFTNNGFASDSGIHAGFQWVIAPAGDPSLAPDIASNSWGTDNGFDTTFQGDVQMLRAAGILAVFANGNAGSSGTGSVGAPASYAESFAVGATDSNDAIASFSSRGPSPLTNMIKPDISAPGVNVTSSFPGGGYQVLSGTSMATPAVAGVAALLKQAQPSLTLTETMFVITSTALPLGSVVPNNDYGWGRVDAYAATLRVTASGLLSGTITSSGAPIGGARITATDRISRTADAFSDGNGQYQLPLSPGPYWVSVSAFGYAPSLNNSVTVSAAQTTPFSVDLAPLPSGVVQGHVSEAGSGLPISATVSILDTPAAAGTDASGYYSLTLPAGEYTLRAESWLHRTLTATLSVQAGTIVTSDFLLPTAPSILLVDSGAWYYQSEINYYRTALDALGYPYHLHTISSTITAAPTITEVQAYSLTIWSSPLDSPDYVSAGGTLTQYLDQGGRLLLSGQDVAYWDAGGPQVIGYDYFPNRLYGRFNVDSVNADYAAGVAGEALQGITLTVNYSDSARNQNSLDSVLPTDERARPLALYQHGEIAGLAVSTCLPYRAAYLGFGLEGVGPASARQAALHGLIDWLVAPPPEHAFTLSADYSIAVGLPGQVVTHGLTMRNTGILADDFALSASGNLWTSTLFNGAFTQTLTSPLHLVSCASQSIGLKTTIPLTASRNVSDSVAFNVQSLAAPALSLTRTLTSKTPAPVLLVDDDRWYEQESHYIAALGARGIAFDLFDTHGGSGPSLARMQMYPVVVWFSSYDWFDPLNASDEQHLAGYLDSGGRLFYTAQDYLDVRYAQSSFGRDYLGVAGYTNDVTVTVASGVPGNPISDEFGDLPLKYPFFNFSDYVTPTLTASPVFIGNHVALSGITTHQLVSNSKTVFFAFPFETIDDSQEPAVMNDIVGWLSPLGDTTLAVPAAASPGATLAYALHVSSSSLSFASSASISVTLPPSVTLGALGDPALTYDAPSRIVRWTGTLTSPLTLPWTVSVDPLAAPGAWLNATVTVRDENENLSFTRTARTLLANHWYYLPDIGR